MSLRNEARLIEYLRARVPGIADPIVIEPIQGGQSNPTFRVKSPGGQYVLRKQPDGEPCLRRMRSTASTA